MSLLPPDQIIREFFDGLDLSQIDADLRLASLQDHCTKNRDPKTCFLTVAFVANHGPIIPWGFRLKKHIGSKEITFAQYLDLVHPAWTDYYNALAQVVYKIAANNPDWAKLPEACYIVNVPLRKKGGKDYRWFRQASIPAMVDSSSGMLAAHLNYYTDLGPYNDHLPEAPTVYALFPDDPQDKKLSRLQEEFAAGLPAFRFTLTSGLSALQRQILHAYSRHLCENAAAPTLPELMALMPPPAGEEPEDQERAKANLKRARTRLAQALSDHFKTSGPLANPTIFAKRLNLLFGCPQGTDKETS